MSKTSIWDIVSDNGKFEDSMISKLEREALKNAVMFQLLKIPLRQRKAFMLAYGYECEKMKNAEIAALLGVTRTTISNWNKIVLKKLRHPSSLTNRTWRKGEIPYCLYFDDGDTYILWTQESDEKPKKKKKRRKALVKYIEQQSFPANIQHAESTPNEIKHKSKLFVPEYRPIYDGRVKRAMELIEKYRNRGIKDD